MTEYFWECPECQLDDREAGSLATEAQWKCGLCAGDNGRDVAIVKWPAYPGMSRDDAKSAHARHVSARHA